MRHQRMSIRYCRLIFSAALDILRFIIVLEVFRMKLKETYLIESSARAWSKSSLPAFLSFALAFLAAFFSFFGRGVLLLGDFDGVPTIAGETGRGEAIASAAGFFFFFFAYGNMSQVFGFEARSHLSRFGN